MNSGRKQSSKSDHHQPCRKIESFAEKIFARPATLVTPLIIGGFNVLYPMRIDGLSANALIRCPIPPRHISRRENACGSRDGCMHQPTHSCPGSETPQPYIDPDIGPFMIIQDLGSRRGRHGPGSRSSPRGVSQIGQTKPTVSFGFAEENWSARSKYAPATLPAPDGWGSFRLWSDDSRPANILVDENDHVLGAIDWEFAYVGPTQFALDPPWWLQLDVPEMWDDGIERRLQTWRSAMKEVEQDMSPGSLLLAAYMRESWVTGRFWLNYAARKGWAFDTVCWKYMDERFFGERERDVPTEEVWKTKVQLLNQEDQAAMEPLVLTKMEESNKRVLIEWDAAEARKRPSPLLFD
ncbi:hypothetical protein TOPH_08099 [Tolypocladium ophioglossoides CBS 100239]|uniref:Aminoglycoside phosphotransferase domain-containing protein n=1 Tax=Tolypocladium ophioglossoides (strain CBS 100239) TaxID=1163406 RepID=A0A0L0MZE5_TOLOC|nr:hypothetical protein TOPH_08099 [Tolypocladium ophioglossoides CBS 100239]